MAIDIQQLIDKEKEAEGRVQMAIMSKETARCRAIQDAELALGIIQAEHNSKIQKLEEDLELHIQKLKKELDNELQSYIKTLNRKNISDCVTELSKIITGNDQGKFY